MTRSLATDRLRMVRAALADCAAAVDELESVLDLAEAAARKVDTIDLAFLTKKAA